MLTDRAQCAGRGRSLEETVATAVAGGARAVVLREKDLPPAERLRLGERLLTLLQPVGGILVVASDPSLARSLGTEWTHLAAADSAPATGASEGPGRMRFGRSCHSPAEVLAAGREGAAYATASPIFFSASKPGHGPALGLPGLTALAALPGAPPLYALGGVTPEHAAACLAAGAHGAAVMGTIMSAAHPDRIAALLVAALRDAQGVAPGQPRGRPR